MKWRILVGALLVGAGLGIMAGFSHERSVAVSTKVDAPTIYLTFDDGPSIQTGKILEILDQYDIKATFFVTATNPGSYDEITLADRAGHVIGLHTATHNYAAIYSSTDAYFNDLALVNQIVEEKTGKKTNYIRFPGGSSNTISEKYCQGIMHVLVKEVTKRGYHYFDWNGEIGDAKENVTVESLIENGKAQVDGKHDVMLLMHDGGANGDTVEALPTLIEYYQSLGYVFKTISSDAPGFHHKIYN